MSAVLVVQDEAVSSSPGPREGGPRRRRAFTAREKLDYLTAYEAACAASDGGGGGFRSSHRVFSEARSGVDWWGRCYFPSGTRDRAIHRR